MKALLLLAIRFYWRIVPESRRRRCLFRETCSRYVYRATAHVGFRAGIRALMERAAQCRPGYTVHTTMANLEVVCRNGKIIRADAINPGLLSGPSRRPA